MNGYCETCGAADGPYSWREGFTQKLYTACSLACLAHIVKNKGEVDMSEIELNAVHAARKECGAPLVKWDVSDLAQLDATQWEAFCLHVFRTISAQVRVEVSNEMPF
jgi:ABC-type transporter Mla MlaB component